MRNELRVLPHTAAGTTDPFSTGCENGLAKFFRDRVRVEWIVAQLRQFILKEACSNFVKFRGQLFAAEGLKKICVLPTFSKSTLNKRFFGHNRYFKSMGPIIAPHMVQSVSEKDQNGLI